MMELKLANSVPKGTRLTIVIADLGGGGTQRVLVSLISAWVARGYRISVITLSEDIGDTYSLPDHVTRYSVSSTGKSSSLIQSIYSNVSKIFTLRKFIKKSSSDCTISLITSTNVLTIIASFFLKTAIVVSERNDPKRQPVGAPWRFLRWLLYRFSTVVTVNSINGEVSLRSYVPDSKVVYIPNSNMMLSPQSVKNENKEKDKIFLSVGRLHVQKSYEKSIVGFYDSGAFRRGWTYHILGEGPERKGIQELIDHYNLSDCVKLEGFSSNIQEWYEKSSVLLMSSDYEGTPNVVLEALMYSVPVLISETAGDGPYHVKSSGGGIIFGNGRGISLAEAINEFEKNPKYWEDNAERAKNYILEEFSESQVLSKWDEVIAHCVK